MITIPESTVSFTPRLARSARTAFARLAVVLGLTVAGAGSARLQAATAAEDWEAVEKACQPPRPPVEWRTQRPSQEDIAKWREEQGKLAGAAADKAKAFYAAHPADTNAPAAKVKEFEMNQVAVQLGNKERQARLTELEDALLKVPGTAEETRFEIRSSRVQSAAMAKQADGMGAVLAEFEKGARELAKDFPKRPEPYGMLLEVASNADVEKGRKVAQEIVDGSAPDEVKEEARALLKKYDALGKPLALSFKAVDDREVDVAKLKGKVVLVDFWATWCGPCVQELPNVKAAYEKLHGKGFEIVGISFDQEQDALTQFVKEKEMAWPQYFDGKGWQNKFGQEFGINSIPAMWLVDKKGVLRDMNAREDLASKVEKLLAE